MIPLAMGVVSGAVGTGHPTGAFCSATKIVGNALAPGAGFVDEWACKGAGKAVSNTTSSIAEKSLGGITDAIGEGVSKTMAQIATFWVNIDTPNPAGTGTKRDMAPSGTFDTPNSASTGGIEQVLGWMMWIGLVVCLLSLLFAAVKIGTGFRTMVEGENPTRLGLPLLGTILISGAAGMAGALFGHGRLTTASNAVGFLQDRLWWYAVVLAMVSIAYAGIKMAWEGRGDSGRDLIKSLLTMVVITAVGLPALGLLVKAGDSFSQWILMQAMDCHGSADHLRTCTDNAFSGLLGGFIVGSAAAAPATAGASLAAPTIVLILVGLVALITSLIQIVMLAARTCMVWLIAGLLPLAYSATNTEFGHNWSKKLTGSLITWLLYKPVAAIIYAAAFRMQDDATFSCHISNGVVNSKGTCSGGSSLVLLLAILMFPLVACMAYHIIKSWIMPELGGHDGQGFGQGALAPLMAANGAVNLARPFLDKMLGNKGGKDDDGGGGDGGPPGASNVASQNAGGKGLVRAGQQGGGAAGGGGAAAAGGGAAAAAGPAGLVLAGAHAAKKTGEAIKDTAVQAAQQADGGQASGGARPARGSDGGSGRADPGAMSSFQRGVSRARNEGSNTVRGEVVDDGPDLPGGSS